MVFGYPHFGKPPFRHDPRTRVPWRLSQAHSEVMVWWWSILPQQQRSTKNWIGEAETKLCAMWCALVSHPVKALKETLDRIPVQHSLGSASVAKPVCAKFVRDLYQQFTMAVEKSGFSAEVDEHLNGRNSWRSLAQALLPRHTFAGRSSLYLFCLYPLGHMF